MFDGAGKRKFKVFFRRAAAWLLLFSALLGSSSPKNVNAAFEPDTAFYNWLSDFVSQTSYQRSFSELSAYYKYLGLSETVANTLARAGAASYTLSHALNSAVTGVWDTLTTGQKSKLENLYRQTTGFGGGQAGEGGEFGGGHSRGGGAGKRFTVPKSDIDPILKMFDPAIQDLFPIEPSAPPSDSNSYLGLGVDVVTMDEFWTKYGDPYNDLASSYGLSDKKLSLSIWNSSFIPGTNNKPYVTLFNSLTITSSASSPNGYYYQHYNYIVQGKEFIKMTAPVLARTEWLTNTFYIPSTFYDFAYGYVYNRVGAALPYSYGVKSSGDRVQLHGKIVGEVKYVYVVYTPVADTVQVPGDVIYRYYGGDTYQTTNTTNNYYYEYNTENSYPTVVNNTYIQNDDWYADLLLVLKNQPADDVYNININIYIDGGGDGGGDGEGGGDYGADLLHIRQTLDDIKTAVLQLLTIVGNMVMPQITVSAPDVNVTVETEDYTSLLEQIIELLEGITTIDSGGGRTSIWDVFWKFFDTAGIFAQAVASITKSISDLGISLIENITDLLKTLFIPDRTEFETQTTRVKDAVNERLPFIGEVMGAYDELAAVYGEYSDGGETQAVGFALAGVDVFDSSEGFDADPIEGEGGAAVNPPLISKIPTITITLPENFGGGEYSVIDFEIFERYRSFVHGFILIISYTLALRKVFRKYSHLI